MEILLSAKWLYCIYLCCFWQINHWAYVIVNILLKSKHELKTQILRFFHKVFCSDCAQNISMAVVLWIRFVKIFFSMRIGTLRNMNFTSISLSRYQLTLTVTYIQCFVVGSLPWGGLLGGRRHAGKYVDGLTHLPLDKMAANLADDDFKCIFLNENDFHWNLFPGAQLTISQHWFR